MTAAELSLRMEVPHYGSGELDLVAEYTYDARYREMTLHAVVAEIGGAQIVVWHYLTPNQRQEITDACVEDYHDRTASAVEARRKAREYDAWA